MDRVTKDASGIYCWSCSIDRDFHQKAAEQGKTACIIAFSVLALVAGMFAVMTRSSEMLWLSLLIIGGVLGLSLLLFRLYASAEDPHEQYQMTEEYVRSGYGRSAVYSDFDKTTSATFSPRYIELTRKGKAHRIYVPAEDMAFVRDYILSRLPAETDITRL